MHEGLYASRPRYSHPSPASTASTQATILSVPPSDLGFPLSARAVAPSCYAQGEPVQRGQRVQLSKVEVDLCDLQNLKPRGVIKSVLDLGSHLTSAMEKENEQMDRLEAGLRRLRAAMDSDTPPPNASLGSRHDVPTRRSNGELSKVEVDSKSHVLEQQLVGAQARLRDVMASCEADVNRVKSLEKSWENQLADAQTRLEEVASAREADKLRADALERSLQHGPGDSSSIAEVERTIVLEKRLVQSQEEVQEMMAACESDAAHLRRLEETTALKDAEKTRMMVLEQSLEMRSEVAREELAQMSVRYKDLEGRLQSASSQAGANDAELLHTSERLKQSEDRELALQAQLTELAMRSTIEEAGRTSNQTPHDKDAPPKIAVMRMLAKEVDAIREINDAPSTTLLLALVHAIEEAEQERNTLEAQSEDLPIFSPRAQVDIQEARSLASKCLEEKAYAANAGIDDLSQSEVSALKLSLNEKDVLLSKMRDDLEAAVAEARLANHELTHFEDAGANHSALSVEVDALKTARKEDEERVEAAEGMVAKLKDEMDGLEALTVTRVKSLAKHSAENREYETECGEYRQRVEASETLMTKLQEEADGLQRASDEYLKRRDSAQFKFGQLQESSTEELSELTSELDEKNALIARMRADLDAELSEARSKDIDLGGLEEKNAFVTKIQDEVTKLESEADEYLARKKSAEIKLTQLQDSSASEVAALASSLQEKDTLILRMREELDASLAEMQSKDVGLARLEEASASVAKLQEEADGLQRASDEYLKRRDSAQFKFGQLQESSTEELSELTSELDEKNALIARMRANLDSLEEKNTFVTKMEDEATKLQSEADEYLARKRSADFKLTQFQDSSASEVATLASSLKEKDTLIMKMREELDASLAEMQAKDVGLARLEEASASVAKLQQEVDGLQDQSDEYLQRQKSAEIKLVQLRDSSANEAAALSSSLDEKDRIVMQMRQDLDASLSEMQLKNISLERLEETSVLVAKLQEEVAELQSQSDDYLQRRKSAEIKLVQLRDSSANEAAALTSSLNEKDKHLMKLREDFDAVSLSQEQLKDIGLERLEEASALVTKLQEQADGLQSQRDEYLQLSDEYLHRKKSAELELARLRDSSKEEITVLTSSLNEKDALLATMARDLETALAEARSTKMELERFEEAAGSSVEEGPVVKRVCEETAKRVEGIDEVQAQRDAPQEDDERVERIKAKLEVLVASEARKEEETAASCRAEFEKASVPPEGWQDIRKAYFPDCRSSMEDVERMYDDTWVEQRQMVIEGSYLWSISGATVCANLGEENLFLTKAELFKKEACIGVRAAVESLNTLEGHVACPEGYCVVYTERNQTYLLLCRSDKAISLESLTEFPSNRETDKQLSNSPSVSQTREQAAETTGAIGASSFQTSADGPEVSSLPPAQNKFEDACEERVGPDDTMNTFGDSVKLKYIDFPQTSMAWTSRRESEDSAVSAARTEDSDGSGIYTFRAKPEDSKEADVMQRSADWPETGTAWPTSQNAPYNIGNDDDSSASENTTGEISRQTSTDWIEASTTLPVSQTGQASFGNAAESNAIENAFGDGSQQISTDWPEPSTTWPVEQSDQDNFGKDAESNSFENPFADSNLQASSDWPESSTTWPAAENESSATWLASQNDQYNFGNDAESNMNAFGDSTLQTSSDWPETSTAWPAAQKEEDSFGNGAESNTVENAFGDSTLQTSSDWPEPSTTWLSSQNDPDNFGNATESNTIENAFGDSTLQTSTDWPQTSTTWLSTDKDQASVDTSAVPADCSDAVRSHSEIGSFTADPVQSDDSVQSQSLQNLSHAASNGSLERALEIESGSLASSAQDCASTAVAKFIPGYHCPECQHSWRPGNAPAGYCDRCPGRIELEDGMLEDAPHEPEDVQPPEPEDVQLASVAEDVQPASVETHTPADDGFQTGETKEAAPEPAEADSSDSNTTDSSDSDTNPSSNMASKTGDAPAVAHTKESSPQVRDAPPLEANSSLFPVPTSPPRSFRPRRDSDSSTEHAEVSQPRRKRSSNPFVDSPSKDTPQGSFSDSWPDVSEQTAEASAAGPFDVWAETQQSSQRKQSASESEAFSWDSMSPMSNSFNRAGSFSDTWPGASDPFRSDGVSPASAWGQDSSTIDPFLERESGDDPARANSKGSISGGWNWTSDVGTSKAWPPVDAPLKKDGGSSSSSSGSNSSEDSSDVDPFEVDSAVRGPENESLTAQMHGEDEETEVGLPRRQISFDPSSEGFGSLQPERIDDRISNSNSSEDDEELRSHTKNHTAEAFSEPLPDDGDNKPPSARNSEEGFNMLEHEDEGDGLNGSDSSDSDDASTKDIPSVKPVSTDIFSETWPQPEGTPVANMVASEGFNPFLDTSADSSQVLGSRNDTSSLAFGDDDPFSCEPAEAKASTATVFSDIWSQVDQTQTHFPVEPDYWNTGGVDDSAFTGGSSGQQSIGITQTVRRRVTPHREGVPSSPISRGGVLELAEQNGRVSVCYCVLHIQRGRRGRFSMYADEACEAPISEDEITGDTKIFSVGEQCFTVGERRFRARTTHEKQQWLRNLKFEILSLAKVSPQQALENADATSDQLDHTPSKCIRCAEWFEGIPFEKLPIANEKAAIHIHSDAGSPMKNGSRASEECAISPSTLEPPDSASPVSDFEVPELSDREQDWLQTGETESYRTAGYWPCCQVRRTT